MSTGDTPTSGVSEGNIAPRPYAVDATRSYAEARLELALQDARHARRELDEERRERKESQAQLADLMSEFRALKERANGQEGNAAQRSVGTSAGTGQAGATSYEARLQEPAVNHAEPLLAHQIHDTNTHLAKLQKLNGRLESLERAVYDTSGIAKPQFLARPGPFSPGILSVVGPVHAKTPKITPYTGTTDPFSHMDAFTRSTAARGYNDATLCHLFSETLDGEAMCWFFECPPNSVHSFRQLTVEFLTRFQLVTNGDNQTVKLFKQKQKAGEGLRAFVVRFRSAVSKCRDFTKEAGLLAFLECLQPGLFLMRLNERFRHATYDEVMAEAVIYAQAEYNTYGAGSASPGLLALTAGPSRQPIGSSGQNASNNANERKRECPSQVKDQDKRPKERDAQQNSTYETIFEENRDLIPPPTGYPRPGGQRNTGEWCKYHEDSSHATNACRSLGYAIEELHASGKMDRYIP